MLQYQCTNAEGKDKKVCDEKEDCLQLLPENVLLAFIVLHLGRLYSVHFAYFVLYIWLDHRFNVDGASLRMFPTILAAEKIRSMSFKTCFAGAALLCLSLVLLYAGERRFISMTATHQDIFRLVNLRCLQVNNKRVFVLLIGHLNNIFSK